MRAHSLFSLAAIMAALSPPAEAAPPASNGDSAIVVGESSLSVTGLKQSYFSDESIRIAVSVPRQNVLRARTELALLRGDAKGQLIHQDIRDQDRYTSADLLHFNIRLPAAERRGELTLLIRVRGVRTQGQGTPAEAFEESVTYPLAYKQKEGKGQAKQPVVKEVRLEKNIYFGFDSAALDAKASATLKKWVKALGKATHLTEVRVEGHADRVGSVNYNLELSRRRAEVVRTALIEKGVPGHVIRVVGMGFQNPNVEDEGDRETGGTWQNRRTEVVFFHGGAAAP